MLAQRPQDDVDRDEAGRDDSSSFETDRMVDDQPPREDLIDIETLEELSEQETGERAGDDRQPTAPADDRGADEAGIMPSAEQQPETQGMDIADAPQETEDTGRRHPLSDEE